MTRMMINPCAGTPGVEAAREPGLSGQQKLTLAQRDYDAWMTRFFEVSRAYLARQRTADTTPVLRYRAGEKGSWPSPIFYPFELQIETGGKHVV